MTFKKKYSYRIMPEHVDFQKNISPIVLADKILNAAGNDADEHGFGLMDLHEKNCSWVVSRFLMEMESIPTVRLSPTVGMLSISIRKAYQLWEIILQLKRG